MKNLNFCFLFFFLVASSFSSCEEESFDASDDYVPTDNDYGKRCGTNSYMYNLMQDPAFALSYKEKENTLQKSLSLVPKSAKSGCNNPVLLPVAVHFYGVSGTNMQCLIDLAGQQIESLNQDFSAQNNDIANWDQVRQAYFNGIDNGQACFQFVLANKNHPTSSGLSNGEFAVTANQYSSVGWNGYINIFVKNAGGTLGYSPLGGNGNGDGVVISMQSFGAAVCGNVGGAYPFDLGRTLTHEMGHYLGLRHIWGDGPCGYDDGISDTPPQAMPSDACRQVGAGSCSTVDLHMNFMDYSFDQCMYMFTAEQVAVMENYVDAYLKQRLYSADQVSNQSGGSNASSGSNTSCSAPSLQVGGLVLSWNAISAAANYELKYKLASSSTWESLDLNNTQVSAEGLPNGTYQFKVRARCGQSTYSNYSQTKTMQIGSGFSSGGAAQQSFVMQVTLDNYASETTFGILDASGNTLAVYGPFANGAAGQTVSRQVDLGAGSYTFVIQDSYGDGICCSSGQGNVELFLNGAFLENLGGNFTSQMTYDFVIQ